VAQHQPVARPPPPWHSRWRASQRNLRCALSSPSMTASMTSFGLGAPRAPKRSYARRLSRSSTRLAGGASRSGVARPSKLAPALIQAPAVAGTLVRLRRSARIMRTLNAAHKDSALDHEPIPHNPEVQIMDPIPNSGLDPLADSVVGDAVFASDGAKLTVSRSERSCSYEGRGTFRRCGCGSCGPLLAPRSRHTRTLVRVPDGEALALQVFSKAGEPGIEPGLGGPKPPVLPSYTTPQLYIVGASSHVI
jgi:hypothetical protein